MKKLMSLLLSIALLVTLIPIYGSSFTASANNVNDRYFVFTNEGVDKSSARIVSTKNINLQGTIYNVTGSSVSYKVIQVPAQGTDPENLSNYTQTPNITIGVSVTGNTLNIQNLELYPGMNRIEFTGISGAGEVKGAIYIEYRDSPMLTNLRYSYNNSSATIYPEEDTVTMLYRPTSATVPDQLSITGNAPNASKVELVFNGYAYEYQVSSNNSFVFNFGSLPLQSGLNEAVFKITSGAHEFTTTRHIVLYNNRPVYYDVNLLFDGTSADTRHPYVSNGEYVVATDVEKIVYESTILVPKPFILDSTTTFTDAAAFQTHLQANPTDLRLTYTIPDTSTGAAPGATVTVTNNPLPADISVVDDGSSYFKVTAPVAIANSAAQVTAVRDKTVSFRLGLAMENDTVLSQSYIVRLVDGSAMYIADINYMSGYRADLVTADDTDPSVAASNPNTFLSMQSTNIPEPTATPINAIDVHNVPFMVELYIGQYTTMGVTDLINNLELRSGNTTLVKKVLTDTAGNIVSQPVPGTPYTRIFLEVSNLRVTGRNAIDFRFLNSTVGGSKFNTEAKRYNFNLMTGPYVRFDGVENGENIPFRSNLDDVHDILNALGLLKGTMFNVMNTNEIVYKAPATSADPDQTVFLFINNVEIPLRATSTDKTSFEPIGVLDSDSPTDKSALESKLSVINLGGPNTIKFTFFSNSYNFTMTNTFVVEPKNLPKIPSEKSPSVYPYESFTQWPPVYNANAFASVGSTYTTRSATANIIGSFDIYDLSSNASLSTSADVQLVADGLRGSAGAGTATNTSGNFKVVISSPDWTEPYVWTIGNSFYLSNSDKELYLPGTFGTTTESFDDAALINEDNPVMNHPHAQNVRMIYNVEQNFFYFNIINQNMPEDNSPLVYVTTVYNAGDGGPRASYRVEINPIAVPYTIESPKAEYRLTNSNYVEVVITSPGADSVIINKEVAEKIKYIHYKDSQNGTEIDAFRVVVKNLKANRDTNIPFTINRAGITTTGTIPVKYVPTNIPGAEYMETMKNSHKVFDGALTLTFPRNTNLIRSDYANNNNFATQVYNSHDILFSIANSLDGIVNRHLFDTTVSDYEVNSKRDGNEIISNKFLSYAGRYIKASQVFWIDAGLADDPNSGGYDPYVRGLDPFPYPNKPGVNQLGVSFRKMLASREIIPSKPGSLTLQYDNSIVTTASNSVTVFHYDPVTERWENIGGVVDTKKGTITVPFNKFGYYVVAKLTRSFNDVTFHSYARDAMETIYAKGIMNAVNSAVQFGGDEYVTRGEFARMIVKALDLPLNYSGTVHFNYYPETTDINRAESLYDYRHIETAARAGIVNGTAPGFFDETAQLQRKDAAVILARALELKLETSSTKAKTEAAKAFQDSVDIDYYALPSVLAIQKKGFIKGLPINPGDLKEGYVFQPNARLLRSDAAIIIARLLTDQKKLPQLYL